MISNPPYVKLQNYKHVLPEVADYLRRATAPGLATAGLRYQSAQTGNTDLFLPFIEKGLTLLRTGGRLGYIAPSLWLQSEYGKGLRRLIHRGRHLERWVNFGCFQVFEDAITYTALQFFTSGPNEAVRFHDAPTGIVAPDWADVDCAVPYNYLSEEAPWVFLPRVERDVLSAINARCTPLSEVASIAVGLQSNSNKIYHLRRLDVNKYEAASRRMVEIEDELMLPLVRGKDVARWTTPVPTKRILFPYERSADDRMQVISAGDMDARYPLGWKYLLAHEATLSDGAQQDDEVNDETNDDETDDETEDAGVSSKRPAEWWAYRYPRISR